METNEPTDDELIARSRSSPELFGSLYERHAVAVFRFLARRVGPGPSEDLVGDVFVVALEARLRYRPHVSGSALPWLYGISGNVARAHLRKRRPEAMVDAELDRGLDRGLDPMIDADVGVDWSAVDERLDAQASRAELRRALVALTPSEREVFLLVAWEGLSATEAGRALGVTPAVVRTRLSRARGRARTVLRAAPLPTL